MWTQEWQAASFWGGVTKGRRGSAFPLTEVTLERSTSQYTMAHQNKNVQFYAGVM